MLISLRGTSGSGKSTIARKVLGLFETRTPVYKEKRKKPVGYQLFKPNTVPLFIPGHYEEPEGGGCDSLKNYDEVFGLINEYREKGCNVFYEGLLLSEDFKRTVALHKEGVEIKVAFISLPVEDCIASINIRRRKKNPFAEDVNPNNTTNRYNFLQNLQKRLIVEGVDVSSFDREGCFEFIKRELSL